MFSESRQSQSTSADDRDINDKIFGARASRGMREVEGAPDLEEQERLNRLKDKNRDRKGVGLTLVSLVSFALSPSLMYVLQMGSGIKFDTTVITIICMAIFAVAAYFAVFSSKHERYSSFRGGLAVGALIVGYVVVCTIFVWSVIN